MRTTIIANDHLLLEFKGLARQRGMSLTALIQEALARYIEGFRKSRKISFTAIGSSSSKTPVARDTDRVIQSSVGRKHREGF